MVKIDSDDIDVFDDPTENLVLAARALVEKLDECKEHINGVFMIAYAHGLRYNGPSYERELEQLRAALP